MVWILGVSLLLLNWMDLILTKLIVNHLGGRELNLVMRPLLRRPRALVVVKMGMTVLVVGIGIYGGLEKALAGLVLVMICLLWWQLRVLRKMLVKVQKEGNGV